MHQKNCHLDKKEVVKKMLLILVISLIIGIIQAIFCRTLFYGFIQIMEIPTKRDLAMGLQLSYWWYIQVVIAIAANFLFLIVKKRLGQIVVLCSQMLLFALFWGGTLSVYPYKVTFLFAVTLCGAVIGYFLCHTIKNKINNK